MKPPDTNNEDDIFETNRQGSMRPLRILVAEDNEINQELLVRMLGKCEHQVEVATNGLEVLALGCGIFDMVIMDIQMPLMSGLEATRAIRRSEVGTEYHLPIIGLSASTQKEEAKICFRAGMDDFITKPVKQDELFAAIEKTVRRSEADLVS